MNVENLKEYLKIVLDMEKECYTLDLLNNQLNIKISSLGNANYIQEPENKCDDGTGFLAAPFLGAIGGGVVIGGILFFLSPWFFMTCVGIGAAIGALVLTFLVLLGDREDKARYNEEIQKYERLRAEDERRVQIEKQEALLYQQELEKLHSQMKKSHKILESLYDMNIIFPKYRNFIMISSIYEYLCAGRCTTLSGHEGAYNILEMEIRLDRIITRLDSIIFQLEAIKQNQYMIYSAIQESNNKLTEIIDSNRTIAQKVQQLNDKGDELNSQVASLQVTSAFSIYLHELNHKELAYRNQMKL